jgi:hypothetical protein
MRSSRNFRLGFAIAGGFLAAAVASTEASAQTYYDDREGISLTAGGGLTGFTDGDLNNSIDTGGSWDVRAAFATRNIISFEAAYIGSAQEMNTFGVENDAVLVGNGAEAALRLNLVPDMSWQPYIIAGAAWRRYDVTDTDVNFSDFNGTDDVFEIPLGGGIAWYFDRFVLDARGQFRAAFDNDLMRASLGRSEDDIHRWGFSANLGYEF